MFKIPPGSITWSLPPAISDDLQQLPSDPLRSILGQYNGFILCNGALHVRGLVDTPKWHSLTHVWRGRGAFHRSYRNANEADIPFAQDCVGDQYLLRNHEVVLLKAESDQLEHLGLDLETFMSVACDDPDSLLSTNPLKSLERPLEPGQLVSVAPPFVVKLECEYSFRAVPTGERLSFLADLALQVRDVPNGSEIVFKIVRNERGA